MTLLIILLLITLIALFAQLGSNYYTQIRVIRRFFKNMGSVPNEVRLKTSVLEDIDYESVFPRGKLDLYTANDTATNRPILVWVHGGGYVGGDKKAPEAWARTIAARLGVAVASINYCLAPEQHYPVPVIQLGEALRFLRDNAERFGLDATRIFLAGDSAGAQITSQFAALVSSPSLQKTMNLFPSLTQEELRGLLLCCGLYDMDTALKTHFPAIRTFLWAYTNEKKLSKFTRKDELSTVKNITADYCDVYLTCGNADPFYKQATALVKTLSQAGVSCDAYLPTSKSKKLGHEYQFLIGTKEADIALDKAVHFIEERL